MHFSFEQSDRETYFDWKKWLNICLVLIRFHSTGHRALDDSAFQLQTSKLQFSNYTFDTSVFLPTNNFVKFIELFQVTFGNLVFAYTESTIGLIDGEKNIQYSMHMYQKTIYKFFTLSCNSTSRCKICKPSVRIVEQWAAQESGSKSGT